jgi:flagellar biosynthesis/type III secretory pathway protein FliH
MEGYGLLCRKDGRKEGGKEGRKEGGKEGRKEGRTDVFKILYSFHSRHRTSTQR